MKNTIMIGIVLVILGLAAYAAWPRKRSRPTSKQGGGSHGGGPGGDLL
jgi:uncharacterized membrane protein